MKTKKILFIVLSCLFFQLVHAQTVVKDPDILDRGISFLEEYKESLLVYQKVYRDIKIQIEEFKTSSEKNLEEKMGIDLSLYSLKILLENIKNEDSRVKEQILILNSLIQIGSYEPERINIYTSLIEEVSSMREEIVTEAKSLL